jgi:hypothetical protein
MNARLRLPIYHHQNRIQLAISLGVSKMIEDVLDLLWLLED